MVEVRAMQTLICGIKIDRAIVSGVLKAGATIPTFIGYRVVGDTFVRSQSRVRTYARVRKHDNCRTGATLDLSYQHVLPKLAPVQIKLTANDHHALCYDDIDQVVRVFATYRLRLVEVAFDFLPDSQVDVDYVRRHALFGKSRPRNSQRFPGKLRYGGRRSDKLVRCYWKPSISRFRVELELHSALLQRLGIVRLEDFKKLPDSLCPSHIRFVCVDWQALKKHLSSRRTSEMEGDLPGVAPTASIHKTLGFLRQRAGVKNVHRLLLSLPVNKRILRALNHWARSYRK